MSRKSSKSKSSPSSKPVARISGRFEGNINAAGAIHIAQGAHCKANIKAGQVCIKGNFEGNMASQGGMQIEGSAKCKGSFHARSLQVDGAIEGQAFVHGKMNMSSSAQMQGHIVASRLVVADGASFDGRCTIGKFVSSPSASRKAA
jgi:cytoskeletal protein CcmA (bactofilin family)